MSYASWRLRRKSSTHRIDTNPEEAPGALKEQNMAPSALKIAEDGARRTEDARDGAKRTDLAHHGARRALSWRRAHQRGAPSRTRTHRVANKAIENTLGCQ